MCATKLRHATATTEASTAAELDRIDRAILSSKFGKAARNRLHAEQLLYLPGVRQIRSFMVVKEILSTTEFPL
jgi:hypothetical protein